MKTKEELLQKYLGNEDYYDVIRAHHGTKTSFQLPEGGLLSFDKNDMKDIVGTENLTYEDFIDIQIQTGKDYRGAFMLCYFYCPMGFKGEVERFSKNKICFKRIFVDGIYPDGIWFEGKEDHVWMDLEGFEQLKIGDCVSFFAEPYRYIKKSNGKRLDFGLRNPKKVEIVDKYDLPSDEDLMLQNINQIICESCYLYDQCTKMDCIRNPKELKSLRKSMLEFLKRE